MINKKLLAVALIASSISLNAFAKTEGNYVGLNLINTFTKSSVGVTTTGSVTKYHNDDYSFGVDYKYAFNFDGFFVAPGIFYDYNAANADFALPETIRFSNNINNSYGVKADFGYDVTDKFSPFVTLGYSMTRQIVSYYSGGQALSKSAANNEGLVYGLGFRYRLTKSLSFAAAYEFTQFGYNSNIDGLVGGTDKLNSDYKVAKLGVAYNF